MSYDPCASLDPLQSLTQNSPAVTIAIDTCHEYSLKQNRTTNTEVNEINNLMDIFQVNFAEEKKKKNARHCISCSTVSMKLFQTLGIKEQDLFWLAATFHNSLMRTGM